MFFCLLKKICLLLLLLLFVTSAMPGTSCTSAFQGDVAVVELLCQMKAGLLPFAPPKAEPDATGQPLPLQIRG